MSPADLSTLMGSERPCSPHPGPASAAGLAASKHRRSIAPGSLAEAALGNS